MFRSRCGSGGPSGGPARLSILCMLESIICNDSCRNLARRHRAASSSGFVARVQYYIRYARDMFVLVEQRYVSRDIQIVHDTESAPLCMEAHQMIRKHHMNYILLFHIATLCLACFIERRCCTKTPEKSHRCPPAWSQGDTHGVCPTINPTTTRISSATQACIRRR